MRYMDNPENLGDGKAVHYSSDYRHIEIESEDGEKATFEFDPKQGKYVRNGGNLPLPDSQLQQFPVIKGWEEALRNNRGRYI